MPPKGPVPPSGAGRFHGAIAGHPPPRAIWPAEASDFALLLHPISRFRTDGEPSQLKRNRPSQTDLGCEPTKDV
jgi:hypothetical protein